MPIAPQPMRSPASPVGWVFMSSGLAWMITDRPMIEFGPWREMSLSTRF